MTNKPRTTIALFTDTFTWNMYTKNIEKRLINSVVHSVFGYTKSATGFCLSFYAPPTIVEGHYVFWSVRPFVRLSVCSSVCPASGLSFWSR